MRRGTRLGLQPVALALASLGVLAPIAPASTVTLSGRELLVTGSGEQNLITVSRLGSDLRLRDVGEGTSSGTPTCTDAGDTVSCPAAQVSAIRVELQDGHDQASVEGDLNATVIGGPGHDAIRHGAGVGVLVGGRGNDVLGGLAGNDVIFGGAGDDLIRGGWGDDQLFGRAGNDVIQAGPGHDLVTGNRGIDQVSAGKDKVRDRVNCGGALDFAILFPQDRARGCEFVKGR